METARQAVDKLKPVAKMIAHDNVAVQMKFPIDTPDIVFCATFIRSINSEDKFRNTFFDCKQSDDPKEHLVVYNSDKSFTSFDSWTRLQVKASDSLVSFIKSQVQSLTKRSFIKGLFGIVVSFLKSSHTKWRAYCNQSTRERYCNVST